MLLGRLFLLFILLILLYVYAHQGGTVVQKTTKTIQPPKNNSNTISPTNSPVSGAEEKPLQPSPTEIVTQQGSIGLFEYPNASKIDQSGRTLTLSSTDDAFLITAWYKEKIRSLGMNVTTFIQTNTNNSILNTLSGSNGSKTVQIEISKPPNKQEVQIKINANEEVRS